MKKSSVNISSNNQRGLLIGLCVALVLLLAYFVYQYISLSDAKEALEQELSQTKAELGQAQSELEAERNEKTLLSEALIREQEKNQEFEDQINELAGTVGLLDKLSKIDKELLQKYSKVYFLNEHYLPPSLRAINKKYVFDDRDLNIHSKVWPFFKDMLEEAEDDGINLRVISAFRSFGDQSSLKSQYVVTYGAGTANQFSAEQGYSEHQLGTTVDFSTKELGASFSAFENTTAYEWLLDNAHKYGFVLSYPKGNSYYQFEPWHWRFVGRDLARYLDRNDLHFYDLDQRKIDEYLVEIFD